MIPLKIFTLPNSNELALNSLLYWLSVSKKNVKTLVHFLKSLSFARISQQPSSGSILHNHCVPGHFTGIHSPHSELCDPRLTSHQLYTLEVVGYRCVFCKGPSSFWSFCILRNFSLQGSAMLPRHHFLVEVLDEAAGESCVQTFFLWRKLLHQSVSELLQPLRKVMHQVSLYPHRYLIFCFGLGIAPDPPGSLRRLRLLRVLTGSRVNYPALRSFH